MHKNVLNSRRNRKTSSTAFSARSGFETLESRQLMSVVPLGPIILQPHRPVAPTGQLVINGTSGNDNILLSFGPSFFADVGLTVTNNGTVILQKTQAEMKSIHSIRVNTLGGDDRFVMANTTLGRKVPTIVDGGVGNDQLFMADSYESVTLKGGEGNDIIRGGRGRDFLDGGAGNDDINAGMGNDAVYAGAGDDKVYGHDDNDRIDGGEGNDNLDGGDDDDIITGGLGRDTLKGGNGNDRFFANDGARDFINGGAGVDTADVNDRPFIFLFSTDDICSQVETVIKH